ncbi:MAG: alpha/beta fold hydrolase [Thermoleophilia bacterium]|nr:alpha/beta fold hydrolase [Thermoleophilia bacterium]
MRILLLHAFPLDERMWEPQQEAFDGASVDAPRLYGLGTTIDEWGQALAQRLTEPAVVVGASMGGYAGLALARHAPDRVLGLVLAGSRPDPDDDARRRGRADTIDLVQREGAEGLWRSLRPKLFPPEAPAEAVERARRIALEQRPEELVTALAVIRDRPDASDVAYELGDRLLVVIGSRDPFVSGEEAHRFGHGASVAQFEGAGHLTNLERPEQFSHVVRDFVARWR